MNRLIPHIRIHSRNPVHNVHPVNNRSKRRVIPVKERSVLMANKELRRSTVLNLSPRHRYSPARMTEIISHPIRLKLTLNSLRRAPHTSPGRIPALYHKPIDNPVEYKPIIKPFLNKLLKVSASNRRHRRIKLKRYNAAIFHFNLNHFAYPF